MKMTMADIAKLAGVSKTTVSRVINDKPDVSREVRAFIKKIMQENDYYPNAAAQSMRGINHVVALVMPNGIDYILANPYYARMIRAIMHGLKKGGYYLLFTHHELGAYIEMVNRSMVDGFIVLSSSMQQNDIVKYLVDNDIPCVATSSLRTAQIPSVDINNYEGGRIATNYLIAKGHKKIAYIYQEHFASFEARKKGYLETLEANGIHGRKDYLVKIKAANIACEYDAAMKLLDLPDPPTAVFTCTDFIALGIIKACAERDVKIPEQLSVMGFDNSDLNQYLTPALTSVDQAVVERGELAAQMLIHYIETGNRPKSMEVEAKLVEGGSVSDRKEKKTGVLRPFDLLSSRFENKI